MTAKSCEAPLAGVLAPAGTPALIIELPHAEILRIVAFPDVKERFDAIGFVPVANQPEEFASIIKEAARSGKIIRAANIKPD